MYIRVTAKCKFLTLVLNKNFQVKYFETWINQSFRTQVSINFNVSQYFALTQTQSGLTHIWPMFSFYTPMKARQKLRFSGVFRLLKVGTLARNKLIKSEIFENWKIFNKLLRLKKAAPMLNHDSHKHLRWNTLQQ